MSQHLLRVKVGDEEADVVALDLLPPQDHEVLRSPHHEAHELVAKQLLDVIRLFDCDRDPDRVDAGLYQDPLLLVPGHDDRVEEKLWRFLDLDLGLVVPLHLLAGEVLQTHGGLQSPLDTQQIRFQCIGHLEAELNLKVFLIELEDIFDKYISQKGSLQSLIKGNLHMSSNVPVFLWRDSLYSGLTSG